MVSSPRLHRSSVAWEGPCFACASHTHGDRIHADNVHALSLSITGVRRLSPRYGNMLAGGAGKSGRQLLSLCVLSIVSVLSRTVTVQREKDGSVDAEHDYLGLQSSGGDRRPR